MDTRPLRVCEACGGVDDHPRHVQLVPLGTAEARPATAVLEAIPDGTPAAALALAMNPTTIIRHMDCCAALGCEQCQATEAVTAGARGAELLAVIQSGVIDHLGSADGEDE